MALQFVQVHAGRQVRVAAAKLEAPQIRRKTREIAGSVGALQGGGIGRDRNVPADGPGIGEMAARPVMIVLVSRSATAGAWPLARVSGEQSAGCLRIASSCASLLEARLRLARARATRGHARGRESRAFVARLLDARPGGGRGCDDRQRGACSASSTRSIASATVGLVRCSSSPQERRAAGGAPLACPRNRSEISGAELKRG